MALTEAQITALVTAAVRSNTNSVGKSPEQKPFSGRAEDLDGFLKECEMRFKVFPNAYGSIKKRVFYVLSLFQTGVAKAWKDQYVSERAGQQHLAPGNDWDQFKAQVVASFSDPGKTQDTMRMLRNLQQGKMSVNELNIKFCLLIGKAGLDATAN